MQRFRQYGGRLGISLGLAALALVAPVVPAFADGDVAGDAGVSYSAGSLSGGAITYGDFAGITLNGTRQTTTATWSIANITDARGTGNGWNLSLTLTPLQQYDTSTGAYVTGGKTLPTSSVTVAVAPTVSQVDPSSGSSAPDTITPVGAGTALDTGSAVKLLSASLDGGMGEFSFGSMTVSLATGASTYAGAYKTTATLSLDDAP
jgi:hypothetical protein